MGNSAISHWSLPVWGAWIETANIAGKFFSLESLPVWGAWIETGITYLGWQSLYSRSPCGERGLKPVAWPR